MNFLYQQLVKPLLFRFEAETAHHLVMDLGIKLKQSDALLDFTRTYFSYQNQALQLNKKGLFFQNPVGVAAGFDKNAQITQVLSALGFGFMEIGSITAKPSKGNPLPRLFRLPEDTALINRLGLNNHGASAIMAKVDKPDAPFVLGVNLAKTHDPAIVGDAALVDYQYSWQQAEAKADFITINVSCPNTTEGKTFEDPEALKELLDALNEVRTRQNLPVLVKFSVDLSPEYLVQLAEICELSGWISGYVCCNTSSIRAGLSTSSTQLEAIGRGGLSGAPLAERSNRLIKTLRSALGEEPLLIGVGGVMDFESAKAKFQAGADLVELYTGLVYKGPLLAAETCKELATDMHQKGISTFSEYLSCLRDEA